MSIGGISETGSDITPNLDKKRSRNAFVTKLSEIPNPIIENKNF